MHALLRRKDKEEYEVIFQVKVCGLNFYFFPSFFFFFVTNGCAYTSRTFSSGVGDSDGMQPATHSIQIVILSRQEKCKFIQQCRQCEFSPIKRSLLALLACFLIYTWNLHI
jgi:hypothetical protein